MYTDFDQEQTHHKPEYNLYQPAPFSSQKLTLSTEQISLILSSATNFERV